jgi:hypothetical protein
MAVGDRQREERCSLMVMESLERKGIGGGKRKEEWKGKRKEG